LVWTLFAFGGLPTWTLAPAAAAIALAAVLIRPQIPHPTSRVLDGLLLACVACAALQIVPLPPGVRDTVSPHALTVDRALPFAAGYLVARIARRGSVAAGVDALSLWIGGAVCAMFAALVVSLSRTGAVGIAGAAVCGGLIAVGRRGSGSRRWLLATAAVALALFASMPISSQLLARFDRLEQNASGGRLQIWRETLPIVRDFTLTGVGLGAYHTAMLVYQRTDRTRLFNQT